jgi:hypothetical protein
MDAFYLWFSGSSFSYTYCNTKGRSDFFCLRMRWDKTSVHTETQHSFLCHSSHRSEQVLRWT